MSSDKISVIVPAYNNAPWLPRCLDSILAQTHQNLEVIVVNDGSTDETEAVLAEYAARVAKVKVIHKPNGGVTSARLRGVAEATGDWIGFVDADDEIEPQMFARLFENANTYGTDISHCGYQRVFPNGKIEYHYNSGSLKQQNKLTGLRDLLDGEFVEPGLCSKLFKRELFQDLEKKMDSSIKNNEDLLMNYYLFAQAKHSVFEDVCPYHYILRPNSASRRKLNENRIYDPIRVREIILTSCEPELEKDARQAMLRTCLYAYALLTVEKGNEYKIHRRNVRRTITEQEAFYPLLSERNQLLAKMIKNAPWLFHIAFSAYVAVFLHGHYE